jgi:hypothetical protein
MLTTVRYLLPHARQLPLSIEVPSHGALHYFKELPTTCLPARLPARPDRAAQVTTLEVPGLVKDTRGEGAKSYFRFQVSEGHFVQEVQSCPSFAVDPCTPRHLALLS